jgi:hypothetical protein
VTNWTGKRRVPAQWSKIAVKGKPDPNAIGECGEFGMKVGPSSIIVLRNRCGV